MKSVEAGKLNRRVTIYEDDPTVNADGQRVEATAPKEICKRWASVMPLSGRERFLAEQTQADVTHRVQMRSDSQTRAITPDMWLTLSDGTRLDIKRVFDVEMARQLVELECNQRV